MEILLPLEADCRVCMPTIVPCRAVQSQAEQLQGGIELFGAHCSGSSLWFCIRSLSYSALQLGHRAGLSSLAASSQILCQHLGRIAEKVCDTPGEV